jgi:hypothetical protein
VRIKRDFGKAHFDLAIDAWQASATRLEKVQLLWVNTSEADRRKPLGRLIERMVSLKYKRVSGRSIKVVVAGDDKEFTFTVEIGHDGALHTYVAVDTRWGAPHPALSDRQLEAAGSTCARESRSASRRSRSAAVMPMANLHSGQVRHKAV